MTAETGKLLFGKEKIEEAVLEFYQKLLGMKSAILERVVITVIRKGRVLNSFQRQELINPLAL